MATDTDQLHFLARNGHFGPNAMNDPTSFVQSHAPALGITVATNSSNEAGITGDYATMPSEHPVGVPPPASADNRKEQDMSDYRAQQGLYQRLLMKNTAQELQEQGIEEPVMPQQ